MMVWFLSRDTNELRVETRYDNDAAEYVLIVHWLDGCRQMERFSTLAHFRERVVELQHTIDVEGWRSAGSPQILRDSWRIAWRGGEDTVATPDARLIGWRINRMPADAGECDES